MTKMIRIRMPDGTTGRDPITGADIPAEGLEVPFTDFWRRQIIRGAVVDMANPPDPNPTPEELGHKAPEPEPAVEETPAFKAKKPAPKPTKAAAKPSKPHKAQPEGD